MNVSRLIVALAGLGLMVGPARADTYPSEAHPADTAVEALDGTTHAQTGLPYVAKYTSPSSVPTYEVQYNRRLLRQNIILAAANQGRVVDEGGLTFGVYPLVYYQGGARKAFGGATGQSVIDDDTTYVWIDDGNTLQSGTNGFPADETAFLPLATLATTNGDISDLDDERGAVLFHVPDVIAGANVLPYNPSMYLAGTLSVKIYEVEWVAPIAFTLKDATGRVATAPTGADLRVDVLDDGVSIFASNPEKVVIAAGTQQDTSAEKNHAVAADSVITIEVEQIGSGTAGADLTIVLDGRAAIQP